MFVLFWQLRWCLKFLIKTSYKWFKMLCAKLQKMTWCVWNAMAVFLSLDGVSGFSYRYEQSAQQTTVKTWKGEKRGWRDKPPRNRGTFGQLISSKWDLSFYLRSIPLLVVWKVRTIGTRGVYANDSKAWESMRRYIETVEIEDSKQFETLY